MCQNYYILHSIKAMWSSCSMTCSVYIWYWSSIHIRRSIICFGKLRGQLDKNFARLANTSLTGTRKAFPALHVLFGIFCSLFYTTSITSSYKALMVRWLVNDESEYIHNTNYQPGICLRQPRETMTILSAEHPSQPTFKQHNKFHYLIIYFA